MNAVHQYVLPSGPARESLREKGQFWTPEWIADAMVAYVLTDETDTIFDPAVGAGAFLRSAKALTAKSNRPIRLSGSELDPDALRQARIHGLAADDLRHVEINDFVLQPPRDSLKAIVANPPYIRHHRLSSTVKTQVRALGTQLIGRPLDGRAGLHVYFLSSVPTAASRSSFPPTHARESLPHSSGAGSPRITALMQSLPSHPRPHRSPALTPTRLSS